MAELQKLTQSFFFFSFLIEPDCKSADFLFHLEENKIFWYLPSCVWPATGPAASPHGSHLEQTSGCSSCCLGKGVRPELGGASSMYSQHLPFSENSLPDIFCMQIHFVVLFCQYRTWISCRISYTCHLIFFLILRRGVVPWRGRERARRKGEDRDNTY